VTTILTIFLSLIPAYFVSFILISGLALVYENLTGKLLGVGAMATFYPIIISTILYTIEFSLLIKDIKKMSKGNHLNFKTHGFDFLAVTLIVIVLTLFVLYV